jgi:enoyl-CoA hydratase/carnithine racemase
MGSVLHEKKASLGISTLTREASLNTLDLEMVCSLKEQFQAWFQDPDVSLIILRGQGNKAFCAGGDVKSVVLKEKQSTQSTYSRDFFSNEYQLDLMIHTSPKPVLVIAHGITMGGGIGLLAGGSCRIVTETSVLAMPEISIGFFPDVGGSYFLSRMPHNLGLFLALTSYRMNASDSIFVGLADLFLQQEKVPSLIEHLTHFRGAKDKRESTRMLMEEVRRFGGQNLKDLPSGPLSDHLDILQVMTQGASILEFHDHMMNTQQPYFKLDPFVKGSPTSAHLIFEQLKRGANLSLEQCFSMELNMALQCCRRHDFSEGVRAVLIDKDQKPLWQPAVLDEVSPQEIQEHFLPIR